MQLQDILYSQGFGTRRVCAGLVQQGGVEVLQSHLGDSPAQCRDSTIRYERIAAACPRRVVAIPREGISDAAQASRYRMLSKAIDLSQHLYPSAAASAAKADQIGSTRGPSHRAPRSGHYRFDFAQ